MPEYYILPEAERDLENVYYEGLLRFGMLQADKYQIALHEKFIFLAKFSGIGTRLKLDEKSARKYSYKAHIIFFEPLDEGVNILRVVHASSDYFKFLDEGI